jgi:hypothetical protein
MNELDILRYKHEGNDIMKRPVFLLAVLLSLTILSCSVFSAEKTGMSIADIINKNLEATDFYGIAANSKTKVQSGVIDMPVQKFSAAVTVEYALPYKCRITWTFANGQKDIWKINGNEAWEVKDGNVREVKGEELRYLIFNTRLDSSKINWKEIFSKVEFEQEQNVSGRECYVLKCSPADRFKIKSTVLFFIDKKDFLIRKMIMSAYSQAGVLRENVVVTKYKNINNVMIPVVTETDILGAKIIYTINSINYNLKLDDSIFEHENVK